jgi:hypothetical protein
MLQGKKRSSKTEEATKQTFLRSKKQRRRR